mgnify:CR=1 FL=1
MIPSDEFDYALMHKYKPQKRKQGNHKTGNRATYLDCVCAFDIETSVIKTGEHYRDTKHEEKIDDVVAIMYIWQFQIEKEITVFGRSWEEFDDLLRKCIKALPEGCNLVVYVHNLSYEFCYLKGIYDFKPEEVFAVQRRPYRPAV